MKLYKEFAAKPHNILVNHTTIPSNNLYVIDSKKCKNIINNGSNEKCPFESERESTKNSCIIIRKK